MELEIRPEPEDDVRAAIAAALAELEGEPDADRSGWKDACGAADVPDET